jgi:ABC-type dipeptide/oligopeptide/nickel transport system ATPase component/ABC-type dipeptide/oligopeptide/nickel transport system permease subunit
VAQPEGENVMSIDLAVTTTDATSEQPARRGTLRRVLLHPVGLVCTIVLATIVALGLLAPIIAPFPANLTRLELTNAPAFVTEYILGGDIAGRDILSRLLYATVGTLQGAVVLLAVSLVLGVVSGLLAGYYGGAFDAIGSWAANIILTLPGLVLLIALFTLLGPRIVLSMAVFGVLVAPGYFWLTRSLVLAVKSELYVDAARVAGLSDRRIIARHILRAVRGPIIVQSAFVLAAGIGIQASLEFLGLGNPTEPSWGGMLNEAFIGIYISPLNILWPAGIISIMTLALVLLGNVVRDVLQTSATRHAALTPSRVRAIRAARPSVHSRGENATEIDPDVLLSVHGLAVGYPSSATTVNEVVHGVDLTISAGEVHGLVGESGSGKSQIAYSVMGILPKEAVITTGEIRFGGRDLLADPKVMRDVRGRQIAYIPQEPMSNLDPTYTVGQQLSYGLRAARPMSKRAAKRKLLELLDRVGIKDPVRVFDQYPHQISGGMAQRVLIAGALACDPELIIADEPTTALDVTVQAEILEILRGLQRERNLGVLLVTHNFGVVADICDRVSVMKDGRIVESRPVDELFADPTHEYTKRLLGSTMDGAPLRAPISTTEGAR